MAHKLQGIFYTKQGGKWLYTVRTDVENSVDAMSKTHELARRFNADACVHIEDWNFPKSELDGFYYSTGEAK
jgi:hypothetical protein